ncbi:MAG: HNH endonuclease [Candidatus Krumholzibacteriota bacterium]
MKCDAAVCRKGGRNTTTIPPRVRREVLARDRHRCQTPGCGRTRFLEVHHKVPRSGGGSNSRENLVTLCGSCHRLWHEQGAGVETLMKTPLPK